MGLALCLPVCRDNGAQGRQCETILIIVDEGMVACGPRHAWKVGGWLNIQQYYVDRDSGRTLLHYAATGNWPALTRVLLVLGANRNARRPCTMRGETAAKAWWRRCCPMARTPTRATS